MPASVHRAGSSWQCLALEARFPEMPLAAVFAIGPTVKVGLPLSLVFLAVSVLMVNQLL